MYRENLGIISNITDHVQSLKEKAINLKPLNKVMDNVQFHLDGVLYLRVIDAFKVGNHEKYAFIISFVYGVDDVEFRMSQ